ncbi:mevalonate kinase [Cimex lectularius]|uniref:Mevalonate kinase n=1 Tax=Cimex lectularius TaxID=79782 RepID=A0A8I6RMN4_CIMLE|nr:mevalonate kinase [Cimex lectularius]
MDYGNVSFSISAPGKVILIGEHSVTYKKQGIAASINKRTYLHFKEHKQAHDQITFKLMNNVTEWDFKSVYNLIILNKPLVVDNIKEFSIFTPELLRHEEFLDLIVDFVSQKVESGNPIQKGVVGIFYIILGMLWCTDINITPYDIEVTTDLIIGAGTGSSASFSVCVAGAVYHYIRLKAAEKHGSGEYNISYEMFKPYKMNLAQHYCGFSAEDKEVINKWAFCVEKIIHGTPSGLDNTVCTFGNTVLINPIERQSESNLQLLENFPSLRILLVNTGIPRSTSELVKKVADLHKLSPEGVGAVLVAMDSIAQEFIKLMQGLKENNDPSDVAAIYRRLELLVDLQQGLLTTIGVSHVRLDEICQITKKRGLHSKLTGAGGGGNAITLVPSDVASDVVEQTVADLRSAGFQVDDIIVSGEGLSLDFK